MMSGAGSRRRRRRVCVSAVLSEGTASQHLDVFSEYLDNTLLERNYEVLHGPPSLDPSAHLPVGTVDHTQLEHATGSEAVTRG